MTAPDVLRFLDNLDALDVPIFTASPGTGCEFADRPLGWADLDAPGNAQRRACWRPGHALCAVMGGRVAGLDCDPRNGGDPAELRRAMAETGVRIYADVATPGNGAHLYVPGHPDLASAMKLDGWPGVEVHSHGTCMYLPGTRRPKYSGAGYRIVADDLAALLDGDDDGAAALLDWADRHRPGSGESFPVAPPWDGATPDARQRAYLDAALAGQAAEVAACPPSGGRYRGRNDAAYFAALKLGNYVAGAGLAEHTVIEALTEACTRNGLDDDDGARSVAATIRSGLRNGRRNPRAVPPAPDDGPTDVGPAPPPGDAGGPGPSSESSTWRPIDLGPYLDGSVRREPPSVGASRSDGLRLLYPGKEHAVIGETESGKSWFALACCAAEIEAGGRAAYVHFEEADPLDTIERLRLLGVAPDKIRTRLAFVGPDTPVTPAELGRLLVPVPSLVVFDGVNEGLALHKLSAREEDGIAEFRHRVVKPCTASGAATLACDHVVKDRERRGRDALGSVHKINGLTGAQFLLDVAEPFGRGLRGRAHLFVVKDRPGHLRRHGRPDRRVTGKTYLAELTVDDTRTLFSYLDLTLWAPAEQVEQLPEVETGDDEVVLSAVRTVIEQGHVPTTKKVRAASPLRESKTDAALERLVLGRLLVESAGRNWPGVPSNARVWSLPATVGPRSNRR
jgi:hypothetical protein